MNASDKPVTHGELETILDKAFAKFALQMGDMFADFAEQIDKRFTRIEERLDRIEARLDRVEARLGGVEPRLDSIEATQQQHSAQLAEINQRLNNHRAESQYHNRLELAEANLNRVMLRTGANPA